MNFIIYILSVDDIVFAGISQSVRSFANIVTPSLSYRSHSSVSVDCSANIVASSSPKQYYTNISG